MRRGGGGGQAAVAVEPGRARHKSTSEAAGQAEAVPQQGEIVGHLGGKWLRLILTFSILYKKFVRF